MPARGDITEPLERFLKLVEEDENGCWRWKGYIWETGYACFWLDEAAGNVRAARWACEFTWGPLESNEPDHLCLVKDCVNPWHLEPVTHKENVRRCDSPPGINARKVVCLRGHAFTPENTYLTKDGQRRQCKICLNLRTQAFVERKMLANIRS
jgi:hypothetical protein